MKKRILIGYWRSESEPDWPDPAWFVDPAWNPEIRDTVIDFLDAGEILISFMGMSWCRFRCRGYGHFLGATELTDGVYRWPSGLSHYLEEHAVRLPDEFVNHVMSQVRPAAPLTSTLQARAEIGVTDDETSWWRAQPGFTTGESFLRPTPNGVAVAVLPPGEPDEARLAFLNRYRFVPYWCLGTEEFLAEVRRGAEYTSKESMDHWRFAEVAAKASEIGLPLKFVVGARS